MLYAAPKSLCREALCDLNISCMRIHCVNSPRRNIVIFVGNTRRSTLGFDSQQSGVGFILCNNILVDWILSSSVYDITHSVDARSNHLPTFDSAPFNKPFDVVCTGAKVQKLELN